MRAQPTAAAARRRWRDDEELTVAVLSRLASGGRLDDLPLGGTDEDRVDLRGLTLPPAEVLDRIDVAGFEFVARSYVRWTGIELTGLDLSHAVLDHLWLTECVIRDCVFDGARLRSGRLFSCWFDRCSFRGADLKDLGAGPIEDDPRTRFRAADFTKADMRRIATPSAAYQDCIFDDTRLDKVSFGGSLIERCRFSGLLSEVEFCRTPWERDRYRPNPMDDVDFSEAELFYVMFRDLELDRVRWPENERVNPRFEAFPCVLRRAQEILASDPRPEARGIAAAFGVALRAMSPRRRVGTVHRRQLEPLADEVIALLRKLEGECR